MFAPSRALAYLVVSMKCLVVVGVHIPPNVCVKTSAKCVRSILETTRQDGRPLVKLYFLFIGIHIIKSDGLTTLIGNLLCFTARGTHGIP